MTAKTLYMIAGEASGDIIGGALIEALKAQAPSIQFLGIGGEQMAQQGLKSQFPMKELSLMGFAELLPHLFRLKRRIAETVEVILQQNPDVLITIDSPGFTFRVVRALRARGFHKPCLHYVAPSVWAYKPRRAAKTAALFDTLLVLLPFEVPYFTVEGLETHWVGHPIAWLHRQKGDGAAFRAQHRIDASAWVLGMMPGSRSGELQRHLPVFRAIAERLAAEEKGNCEIVMPTTQHLAAMLSQATQNWPLRVHISTDKLNALASCHMALAKSGTIALETALAGIPTLTCFKANPLSVWLVKRMIRVPYVNLINIMAHMSGNRAPIPEFIQKECEPDLIGNALVEMRAQPALQEWQLSECAKYLAALGMQEGLSPSEKAASIILAKLGRAASI